MATRKNWTPAELDRLQEAHAAGLPVTEIAREFGRSKGAVRAKILVMGLRRGARSWSRDDKARLRQMFDDGLALPEMAERLDRSADAVARMCHRLDLRHESHTLPWTEEQVSALEGMLIQGLTLEEIAQATGHPRSSVAAKLRQLNLVSLRFRRPWTPQERHTLRTLLAQEATFDQIAAALPARSPVAIRLKLGAMARVADKTMAAAGRPKIRRPALVHVGQGAIHNTPRLSSIPASLQEMERWLRTRDYMVLHTAGGWVVDRHELPTETVFIEFVNLRRCRLNLPPFVKMALAGADIPPVVARSFRRVVVTPVASAA
ncbi:MAG TPA: hypothetical protein VEB64_15095 [Azospirillaceae bacterium]|nr:hypothetical protein [Azospirillaceae bacterium]